MKKVKALQPELIIHVSPRGVEKIRIPFRTIAEQSAGEELQKRCSSAIMLLSKAARGVK